jgi:hypothetical protein
MVFALIAIYVSENQMRGAVPELVRDPAGSLTAPTPKTSSDAFTVPPPSGLRAGANCSTGAFFFSGSGCIVGNLNDRMERLS